MENIDVGSFKRAAVALAECYAAATSPAEGDGGLSRAAAGLGEILDKERSFLVGEIRRLLAQDADIFSDEFDLMSLFGIEDDEVRHTQFLAWLLDPAAPHGLGRRCLHALLKSFEENSHADDLVREDYKVHPEKGTGGLGSVDIEVLGKTFLVLIENKIYAVEGEALAPDGSETRRAQPQLLRYVEYADRLCRERGIEKCYLVFLCLDPEGAMRSDASRFQCLTWATLGKALWMLVRQSENVPQSASHVIQRYLLTVRRLACPAWRYREIVADVLAGTDGAAGVRLSVLREIGKLAEEWARA